MNIVYFLALFPAILWGIEPILSKKGLVNGGSSLQASLTVVIIDSIIYLGILVTTQNDIFANLPIEAIGLFFAAGFVGTALGRISIFASVDRVGASVHSSVISIRPLFAVILAIAFLGESITLSLVLGIIVVVVGLSMLGRSKGGDISGWETWELVLPLTAAFLFATGNIARKYGLNAFPDMTLIQALTVNEIGATIALALYAIIKQRKDIITAPKITYLYFGSGALLTATALFSLFAALRIGRIVIVEPLAATAPLFTTILTIFFLRDIERVTKTMVFAIFLIISGVFVIVTEPALINNLIG